MKAPKVRRRLQTQLPCACRDCGRFAAQPPRQRRMETNGIHIGATGYAAAESINGIIYVAGGGQRRARTQCCRPSIQRTNTWTALANMPLTLYQGNGAGVINSQLYVAGG